MTVKNRVKFFCVVLIFLAICCIAATRWDVSLSQKQATRSEFITVFQSIFLGEQVASVKSKFVSSNEKLPKFMVQESKSDLKLLAPAELPRFTTSWILIAKIRNGIVIGKGIRVYEGWYQPCDAPADEGEIEQPEKTPNGKSCI